MFQDSYDIYYGAILRLDFSLFLSNFLNRAVQIRIDSDTLFASGSIFIKGGLFLFLLLGLLIGTIFLL